MYIKTRVIVVLIVAIVLAMVAEWQYVALVTKVNTLRYCHALFDAEVGEPYVEFIHQLRMLSDSGQADKLGQALRGADEQSLDIYNVWRSDNADAYASSIHKMMK
jgi:hypothetical protein